MPGKLNEHLHQIDEECNQMMDRLVEQSERKARRDGRTEVAESDGMGWGGFYARYIGLEDKMSDLIDKWCSLEETAEYLGVTKDTIRNWIKNRYTGAQKLEDYGNLN